MRYAQILNNKVHWIFEDSLTLEQLGEQKYNLSQITLVDITNITDVAEGYSYDGTSFTNPNVPISDAEFLANAKSSKLSQIDTWTKTAITGGFTSDATGSSVKFDSDEATQLTMQTMYAASQSLDFATNPTYQGHIPVRGYPEGSTEKTVFNLDATQVQKFMDDLALHIGTCKQHGWELQNATNVATTVDEVTAIVW